MQNTDISRAKEALNVEAKAIKMAADLLDDNFIEAVSALSETAGRIVCTGIGKSGHIARKAAATLASTGSPAFFMHPSEGMHGDLGMIDPKDTVLALAYSGETEEVIEVARYARRIGAKIVSITGNIESSLAKLSTSAINGSVDQEACPLNLAPTTSSTLAMALCDALAVCVMARKDFKQEQFAAIHPSGALGRKFKKVSELMRIDFTKIQPRSNFEQVLEAMQEKNYGLVCIVENNSSEILGVVTDGDLRRAVKNHNKKVFDLTAEQIMTNSPKAISENSLAIDALTVMEQSKTTALVVTPLPTDPSAKGIGIIRMHDLIEAKIL